MNSDETSPAPQHMPFHQDQPYAEAAWTYRKAGWLGVIPVGNRAAQKSPPPADYTGWAGRDPSGADVQAWIETHPERNIALHLPHGVYVLDVDVYNAKDGGAGLAALAESLGELILPPTWTSTARGHGPSRQHFYRAVLPEGRLWKDHPVPGTESLHTGHRYAVVWPSINPDAVSAIGPRTYYWYDPDGEMYEGVPEIADLTELPAAWINAFSQEGVALEGSAAGAQETHAVLELFRAAPMCKRVDALLGRELARLADTASGRSIHDAGRLHPLVCYGLEGHGGVREALTRHHAAYVAARMLERGEGKDFASADWWRQVRGSVGKKLAESGGEIRSQCGCDLPETPAAPVDPFGTASSVSGTAPAESAMERSPGGVEPDAADLLLAEMIGFDRLAEHPAPRSLIEGLLTFDSESWLIGEPGSKKSFVALDMGAHVAAGRMWQGLKVTQAPVIMIVAEGAGGSGVRAKAWRKAHPDIDVSKMIFLPRPVQAKTPGKWAVLVEACRRARPGMVIIDTQARVTVGLEENSATEMGIYIEAVRAIREATGACVLTVHHTGRKGGDARGSSAIDGAQSTELKITARAGLQGVLSTEKQKDLEKGDDMPLLFEFVATGADDDGRPVGSLVLVDDPYKIAEAERPAEADLTPLGVSEPQDWTHEYFSNPKQEMSRRALQVLEDGASEYGLTEATVKRVVKEKWYGGKIGKGRGEMKDEGWTTAWSNVLRKVRPDGEKLVSNVAGQRWLVNRD